MNLLLKEEYSGVMVLHIIESEVAEFLFKLHLKKKKRKKPDKQPQGTLSFKPNMFLSLFKQQRLMLFEY